MADDKTTPQDPATSPEPVSAPAGSQPAATSPQPPASQLAASPEPVTVEEQPAKNPLEERLERLENDFTKYTKRERTQRRAEKFSASKDTSTRQPGREMEINKQTKGGGDTRTETDNKTIQRGHRFRFKRKPKPAG